MGPPGSGGRLIDCRAEAAAKTSPRTPPPPNYLPPYAPELDLMVEAVLTETDLAWSPAVVSASILRGHEPEAEPVA
ncbi:hypothetical protein BKA00_006413 [Actinomadura coerulea]|uniref:Uncharacterized protein n=1 Tax=Actinomadura coerulea TaxID=46159 RepID=A0A7X0L2Q8_9ACTN|nr:hypothetical protein [Actinomadura coerulea]MBB6399499.1 hypothetical protein [Actinomadura coerulea]GGQ13315.1 hypothetical protein GCM10010187_32080 [Actinomadura coerulea]